MGLEALVCPSCKGEVELDNDQEFGFCKYCGTKVQNSNFRHVKGKIKIDKETEVNNYYIIARRAIDEEDDETAEKYYDMILQIEPNSYEAIFYRTYCSARKCKIMDIMSSIIKIQNCLDSVYKLMKESLNKKEREEKIAEISNKTNSIIILLVDAYYNHYNSIDLQIRHNYNQEFINTHFAGVLAEEQLVTVLTKYFPESKYFKENAATILSNANIWHIRCVPFFADKDTNIENIHARTERIKELNPSYEEPEINKGGCYVATCIYGSYDCPQVWTLRRYRDYTLSKTWYGRAFIHTYYAVSPTIIKVFGKYRWFKRLWKPKLDKMVTKLQDDGYDSTPYIDKEW